MHVVHIGLLWLIWLVWCSQASFNALTSLPAGMGHLPRLELMRVAVNAIQQVGINHSNFCFTVFMIAAETQSQLQASEHHDACT